jgi:alpha-beta hydrolase superfamily lysophospholipase
MPSLERPPCEHRVTPLPPAHANPQAAQAWTSFDGTRFPYARWKARSTAKATIILIGGWDSTVIDHAILGQHLAAAGYHVYASELRTGRYDPKVSRRGNPDDWEDWVRDLQSFSQFATRENPRLPVYFHGHSFGSLVALAASTAMRDEGRPSGVIIHSPAMPFLLSRLSFVKAALFMPFQGWRVPHLRMGPGPEKSPTGSESLNCRWLKSPDRLQAGYKIRYFVAAAKLGHRVRLDSQTFHLPVLALAGDKDCLVAPKARQREAYLRYLREELCDGRAKLITYPDGFHCMVLPQTGQARLDRTTQKVLSDIDAWLEQRRRADRADARKNARTTAASVVR